MNLKRLILWLVVVGAIGFGAIQLVPYGRDHSNALGQAADEAAEIVSSKQMPPFTYQIMHPEARLSDADRAALVQGLSATFGGGD